MMNDADDDDRQDRADDVARSACVSWKFSAARVCSRMNGPRSLQHEVADQRRDEAEEDAADVDERAQSFSSFGRIGCSGLLRTGLAAVGRAVPGGRAGRAVGRLAGRRSAGRVRVVTAGQEACRSWSREPSGSARRAGATRARRGGV